MSTSAFLKKAHIQNYLSLHDVELPLRPLTVLVGPNASGKSNILEALSLMKNMMKNEDPPPADFILNTIWAGGASSMRLQLEADINDKNVCYTVELKPDEENRISREKLIINGVEVIHVENGKGIVKDEDNTNETDYQSKKLALTSAGDYGNKPITNILNDFIANWRFYNLDPDSIRGGKLEIMSRITGAPPPRELDHDGSSLRYVLHDWNKRSHHRFQEVNQSFAACSNFTIDASENGEDLKFFEGYANPIPIDKISDGTLRLLCYLVMSKQPKLPRLIAIEEPERNLHPAWLSVLSDILNQLADRTQVVITTQSSQLLDTFTPQSLYENLSVLLLHNIPGSGTEVIVLNDVRADRKGLQNWIDEFGIGSAVFDSEILQDMLAVSKEVA